MKKLSALLLSLLILAGCGIKIDLTGDRPVVAPVSSTVLLPDEDGSSVQFDLYPDENPFEIIGRYARAEYTRLSDTQKAIYIALDEAIFEMKTGYIRLGACEKKDIDRVYHALRNDRPEYFWLPSTYLLRTVGKEYEICFAKNEADWLCTTEERRKTESDIKILLTGFVSSLDPSQSQYERELKAHDWLTDRVTYDKAALNAPDEHQYAWSIDGAFLKQKAVCEGYAKAMQVLMFAVGIECGLVTGTTDEAHMWNVVKVDGQWYHLDATHNDGDRETYHFFFNVTTEYMLKSRTIDPLFDEVTDRGNSRYNTFVPLCTATARNYHVMNDLYIGALPQVEPTVVSLICDAIRNGRRSVEFAVSPDIGFVFGETDAAEFFKLQRCVSAANAELSPIERLRSYSYGGVDGALGFVISW